jgi:hypothetical protein
MQYLQIYRLCVLGLKAGTKAALLSLSPIFAPNTHKFNILNTALTLCLSCRKVALIHCWLCIRKLVIPLSASYIFYNQEVNNQQLISQSSTCKTCERGTRKSDIVLWI